MNDIKLPKKYEQHLYLNRYKAITNKYMKKKIN